MYFSKRGYKLYRVMFFAVSVLAMTIFAGKTEAHAASFTHLLISQYGRQA